ncbi:MAG TPA: hypothetical protein VMM76_09790 [Pirellulaceae bacterium]|nr:hypothetical protein [Pirellulaceae bacterium]
MDAPFVTAGEGPGGRITGIAEVNNRLYVVSDNGGFYVVNNPTSSSPRGELQPIFLDGETFVSTGLTNVTGLEFSTLDTNLFHISEALPTFQGPTEMDVRLGFADSRRLPILVDKQQFAGGHGVNPSFDNSRTARSLPDQVEQGRNSFVFGQGNVAGAPRGYDFPGGAHGTLVSNEFDLTGYSAADRPVLYFNYYAATENKDFQPGTIDPLVRDSFRVFIADDNGNWQLLGTNNEFDDGPLGITDELNDISPFEVQPLFDFRTTAAWRQVRIPLDEYAGRENLRLRFDFSTAGGMNVGSVFTGTELRAVAGVYIEDGDTFVIDNRTIEFDSGLTLVTPSGSAIPPRETMTITDTNGQTVVFEFVNSNDFPQSIITPDGAALAEGDTFTVSQGAASAGTGRWCRCDRGRRDVRDPGQSNQRIGNL